MHLKKMQFTDLMGPGSLGSNEDKHSRRKFLSASALFALGLAWPGKLLGQKQGNPKSPHPFGLARSLKREYSYRPKIEGRLPKGLRGVLYRNGPGLFERDGYSKRCIIDGDGMIQAFVLGDGQARFKNKFVRTEKFLEEQKEREFLYASFTTRAPGGFLFNLANRIKSQAGVTVIKRNEALYAFDEYSAPYTLHPESLATLGQTNFGLEDVNFQAHSKIDPQTGDWVHFGMQFGRKYTLNLVVLDAKNRVKSYRNFTLPERYYMHDFFVTQNTIILNLQPALFNIAGFLTGFNALVDGLEWHKELPNKIWVLQKNGPKDEKPLIFETKTHWMWHTLNAYEMSGMIIADFVGYDDPGHFLGKDAHFYSIMQGRNGRLGAYGSIRRISIDMRTKKLRQVVLDDSGYFEFPIVNPARLAYRHRFGYFACYKPKTNKYLFPSIIVRKDMDSGKTSAYDFGKEQYVGEPVFAAKKGYTYRGGNREPGWILSLVYDGKAQKSYLAILDAERVSSGPVAKVLLQHHVPLSFHGYWSAA